MGHENGGWMNDDQRDATRTCGESGHVAGESASCLCCGWPLDGILKRLHERSFRLVDADNEITRITAEMEARFDCHPADGIPRCGACVTCLTNENERLRRERDESMLPPSPENTEAKKYAGWCAEIGEENQALRDKITRLTTERDDARKSAARVALKWGKMRDERDTAIAERDAQTALLHATETALTQASEARDFCKKELGDRYTLPLFPGAIFPRKDFARAAQNRVDNANDERATLAARVGALEGALAFYSNSANWIEDDHVYDEDVPPVFRSAATQDQGKVARATLAPEQPDESAPTEGRRRAPRMSATSSPSQGGLMVWNAASDDTDESEATK